jgi:hypothetical protein
MANAKRKIGIWISRDFLIQDKAIPLEVIERPHGKMSKCAAVLGDFHTNRRGQITEIWDYDGFSPADIEEFAKDARFLEVCDFEAYNSFVDTTKPIAAFEGTFVDAALWVNAHIDEIHREYD